MSSQPSLEELREKVALACRILAQHQLVEGILGHVSARVDEGSMLIRCRGTADRGLLFSEASDVRLVDLDGNHLEASSGYEVPNELAIHGELLRARPDAQSVVHAHPWASVLCGLAGLELRPIVGSFNMPAMRLALDGIPVFPRGCLISRPELAEQMMEAMKDRDVCLLRGHGITVVGESVEGAATRALDLDTLARVTVELAKMGARDVAAISDEDIAELPDLGRGFNEVRVWRYLEAVEALERVRDSITLD